MEIVNVRLRQQPDLYTLRIEEGRFGRGLHRR